MKITDYPTCDDCAYYLTTGDSSGIEFSLESDADDLIDEIDATLAAILKDEHDQGAFVLESLGTVEHSGYATCTFCDDIHLGTATIKIQG